MTESIPDYYKAELDGCAAEIKRYGSLINRYSFLRLFLLVAGIFLFYQSLKIDQSWFPVLIFFSVIFVFAILVRKQNQFEKRRNYFRDLAKIHHNELNSLDRKDNIYQEGSEWADDLHPYTSDLDIFGRSSLFELMNRCATVAGNAKLAGWLRRAAPVEVIRDRQKAVQELSSMSGWKHNFQAVLLFNNGAEHDHAADLFQYMREAAGTCSNRLRIYIRWIPPVFLASAILSWYIPFFLLPLICFGIVNLLLMQNFNARVMKTESLIGKMSKILEHFSEALSAIKKVNWEADLLVQLSADLKDDRKGKLPEQIKSLSVLINNLNFGLSPIGPILNFIMVWNVRQLLAIERWKRENKLNMEAAFDMIATFEALVSLSSLNTNYPAWTFPSINEQQHYTLNVKAIGHPLISSELRIENDFALNNERKIDIITGSNMAGKSTFLRTLGINTVLALSGAPVCAQKMELCPMLVFSYMRIRDSLNESTSTFKAELDRLQALLEILNTEVKVYFLIDEMLRGTNSVDKFLGSKAIIERLISQKAVGIIATHDLQIAELEEKYPDYIRNFHFDIQVEGEEMKFDYKLKKGECRTFNAQMLLKRIGISF